MRIRKSKIQSTNRLLGKEVIESRRRETFGTGVVSKSIVQVQTLLGVMAVGVHNLRSFCLVSDTDDSVQQQDLYQRSQWRTDLMGPQQIGGH